MSNLLVDDTDIASGPLELPHILDQENNPMPIDVPAGTPFSERYKRPRREDFTLQLCEFLFRLSEGCDALHAGRLVLLLAHCCQKTECRTDTELAERLGVTEARISQMRRELVGKVGRVALCNKRTISI